jgi:hypothetical protein
LPADYLPLPQSEGAQKDPLESLVQDFVANQREAVCSADEVLDCLRQENVDILMLADDEFGIPDMQRVMRGCAWVTASS